MSVTISEVEKHSPAEKCGLLAGDKLLTINGHEIDDVLDYRFYMTERVLQLTFSRDGAAHTATLRKKEEYDETGMDFATYLMDAQKGCRNKCVFCFIDQLPKGMRESLYFKDDDSRLSFLFGNYITMTNLTEHEIDRMIRMHISPVNISVHTTDPALRCRMMHNRFAGDALKTLYRFADAGLKLNCQLVLCPGYNDGEALRKTCADLLALAPAVQSVAAVPVGLTKYREGLEPLVSFDRETAGAVIDILEQFGNESLAKNGTRLFYPADEFFLKAGRALPDTGYYEDFYQIENGVGMWSSTRDDYLAALSDAAGDSLPRRFSMATGVAAAPLMEFLMARTKEKFPALDARIYPIQNDFFGRKIVVSGLITGGDIIRQLTGQELWGTLLLPRDCLRTEGDLFLDDTTPDQIAQALSVQTIFTDNDGFALFDAVHSLAEA